MTGAESAIEVAELLLAAAGQEGEQAPDGGPALIRRAVERLAAPAVPPERLEQARLLAVGAYFDGRGDGTRSVADRLAAAARALERARPPAGAPRAMQTIGWVRSAYAAAPGTPLQTVAARGEPARVELEPRYAEGLRDLDGFSHAWVISELHRSAPSEAMLALPFLDSEPRGVFATRAPSRPNPIGLSLVEIVAVEAAALVVDGIDLVDGTPVLDLKPYVPLFDARTTDRVGWLAAAGERVFERRADARYPDASPEGCHDPGQNLTRKDRPT